MQLSSSGLKTKCREIRARNMYTPGGTVLIRTLEVGNVDWKKRR